MGHLRLLRDAGGLAHRLRGGPAADRRRPRRRPFGRLPPPRTAARSRAPASALQGRADNRGPPGRGRPGSAGHGRSGGRPPPRLGRPAGLPRRGAGLAGLRAEGYKLAVLTNCDDDLFVRTQRAVRHPFDLVITAEQVKDYKPSVTHFRRFFRVSGVEMADWVHVACSWFHDIEPARSLGLKRIWVDRDRTGQDPSGASARLADVTGLVAAVHPLMAQ